MQPLQLMTRSLTPRQAAICSLVLQGAHNDEIARELGIGVQSVKNHLRLIYDRLKVRDRVQLIVHYGIEQRGKLAC